MKTQLWSIALVLLAGLIGSVGALYLKKASKEMQMHIKYLFNRKFITGVFFYGVSTVIFIPALKGGELSVLYPLVAAIYIWVALLSMKFLNEKMNKWKWAAILLIIIGIFFIGIGG